MLESVETQLWVAKAVRQYTEMVYLSADLSPS